jgi:hypothetical protein
MSGGWFRGNQWEIAQSSVRSVLGLDPLAVGDFTFIDPE